MKRKAKYIILLIMVIFTIFPSNLVYGDEEGDNYIKEYKNNVYHMAKIMRCIPKTGDINLDYLYEIELLNEGEVEFSEVYIKYASCKEVKEIAERYIEREIILIKNVKLMIEKLKDNPYNNGEQEDKYLKIYNSQLENIIRKFQKVEVTENIDTNFLKLIRIHREGVIGITNEFLKLSDNDEVKAMAYKLNKEMQEDINLISKFIND